MTKERFIETPLGRALLELSEELNKWEGMPKDGLRLDVVGGFAMLVRGLRPADSITDIDFVGPDLANEVEQAADRIGIKHGLGRHWINNDVMLSDISVDDFESSTGKLNFEPMFEIGNIKIRALAEEDLLRMKLISVDTNAMAAEVGGTFARFKDLPDVLSLMDETKTNVDGLLTKFGRYVESEYTIQIIRAYADAGTNGVNAVLSGMPKEYGARLLEKTGREEPASSEGSGFVKNLVNNLFEMYGKKHD